MKRLFMETTGIGTDKTAGEIISKLAGAGASQIASDYSSGRISGLRWQISVNGKPATFVMPARTDAIFAVINGRRKTGRMSKAPEDRIQAERVAWRQLLRWVEAQCAMIDTGMVQHAEVFAAYLTVDGGRTTLFDQLMTTQFKALPAPEEKPQ